MHKVLFFLCFLSFTQAFGWFLYDDQGEKKTIVFSQIPISQKIALVSERQILDAERVKLEAQIEEIKEQIKNQKKHCHAIAQVFELMSIEELEQESKRSRLPCDMIFAQLLIEFKKLNDLHKQIVEKLIHP